MSHPTRRFPPPWSVVTHDEAFSVTDATGTPLAFVYFRARPTDFHHLSRDQARRIAANIAKLPELLTR